MNLIRKLISISILVIPALALGSSITVYNNCDYSTLLISLQSSHLFYVLM